MSAKPYADRLFQYHELGRLSAAAARSALITPAATHGVGCEESAARRVVDESAGYPMTNAPADPAPELEPGGARDRRCPSGPRASDRHAFRLEIPLSGRTNSSPA
jgi:hypothetical protein